MLKSDYNNERKIRMKYADMAISVSDLNKYIKDKIVIQFIK